MPPRKALPFFFSHPGFLWMLFALWLVALAVVSSLTGGSVPSLPFTYWDKVMHFGFFFFGSLVLSLAVFVSLGRRTRFLLILVVAVVSLAGLADEWHQTRVPGRSGGDVRDWTADTLGALAGALLIYKLYGSKRYRHRAAEGEGPAPGDRET